MVLGLRRLLPELQLHALDPLPLLLDSLRRVLDLRPLLHGVQRLILDLLRSKPDLRRPILDPERTVHDPERHPPDLQNPEHDPENPIPGLPPLLLEPGYAAYNLTAHLLPLLGLPRPEPPDSKLAKLILAHCSRVWEEEESGILRQHDPGS